jgi:hypothetical protein
MLCYVVEGRGRTEVGNCEQDELRNRNEANPLSNLWALIHEAERTFRSHQKEIDFHSVGYSYVTANQSMFYERHDFRLPIRSVF